MTNDVHGFLPHRIVEKQNSHPMPRGLGDASSIAVSDIFCDDESLLLTHGLCDCRGRPANAIDDEQNAQRLEGNFRLAVNNVPGVLIAESCLLAKQGRRDIALPRPVLQYLFGVSLLCWYCHWSLSTDYYCHL